MSGPSAGPGPPGVLSRRDLLGLLAGVAASLRLDGSPARAQDAADCTTLRGRHVSWVVGWSPGGGYDIYSRLLEPALERELGAELVVENVPGASGLVAARRISASPPDGRTIGFVYGAGIMLATYTNPQFAPDLERDFTLLGRVADQGQVLVTSPALGAGTLAEFAALGRARTLVLGSTGPATMSLLLQTALARMLGIEVELVLGFPGTAEIMAAALRGDIDGTITSEETALLVPDLPRLLLLAPEPDPGDPVRTDIPILLGPNGVIVTRADLFPSVEAAQRDAAALGVLLEVGRLVAGPPGLEDGIRQCLEHGLEACLGDTEVRERVERAGWRLRPATAAQSREHVRAARAVLPRFAGLLESAVQRARR